MGSLQITQTLVHWQVQAQLADCPAAMFSKTGVSSFRTVSLASTSFFAFFMGPPFVRREVYLGRTASAGHVGRLPPLRIACRSQSSVAVETKIHRNLD